jgi:hypothetical protein
MGKARWGLILQNKNSIIMVVLIVTTVFFVLLAVSSFRNINKTETDFNQKMAVLVKENLDLKDRFESLQVMIARKTEALDTLEKERAVIDEQLNALRRVSVSRNVIFKNNLKTLKKKILTLHKDISGLENSPIVQRIRAAMDKESNENIKKVLEDSANKIDMIKEGKSVDLEPIIVTKKESVVTPIVKEKDEALRADEGKGGVILASDRKNNLIVINLGYNDGVKKGYRCKILKDGQLIGTAETLSVRYKVSAAFVDDLKYNTTMDDLKEGYTIIVPENQ